MTGIYFPYIDCFLMDILLCQHKVELSGFNPPLPTIPVLSHLPLSWGGGINFIYIVKWFNCLAVDLVLEFQTVKLIV